MNKILLSQYVGNFIMDIYIRLASGDCEYPPPFFNNSTAGQTK
jgi:hypothetical protein